MSKLSLIYLTLKKASKLIKDRNLLEDEYGNVFAPMLCLQRIEGSGSNLYTDSDMSEALGLIVYSYPETGIYITEEE